MPTLHLQYLCFVFVLRQAHFNWVGQGRLRWSSLSGWICSRTMSWEVAKPVRRPGDSRRGWYHGRGTLFQSCGRWRDRGSCSELPTWASGLWLGLRNAKIQAINAQMGHEHLFERMTMLYPSTFWWFRSTPPIVLLHCLITNGWPMSILFPSSRPSFDFLDWIYRHQPCWRQCWRHCYRSTSQRLVHSLRDMFIETPLMVLFPFPLLKSRVVAWLTGGGLMQI